jgi:phosphatidylglycerophosphate synthase
MEKLEDKRRPIRARNTGWAAAIARWLAGTGLTPNQISVLSVVSAAIAAACLLFSRDGSLGLRIILFVGAAAFIQLRLLCNLFDGMVAVEGGLASKSGEIYNELPDRISDALVLVCAGYVTNWTGWEHDLGWAAAVLAVITAYVRTLGGQAGASQQFCGPMAKQQRMFILTVASLVSIVELLLHRTLQMMTIALAIIVVGCVFTIVRRTVRIIRELESK